MAQANLNFLLLCENANNIPTPDNEQKLLIVQPIQRLNVPFIPTLMSFDVAAGISKVPAASDFTIKIDCIDAEDKEIFSQQLMGSSGVGNDEFGELTVNFGIRNVMITCEGEFKIRIFLNDDELGKYFFMVKKKELHINAGVKQ